MCTVKCWNNSRIWLLKATLLLFLSGGERTEKLFAQRPAKSLPITEQHLPPTATMATELAEADAFIISYKNDSANLILARLIAELREYQQLDSPFGLKVQLLQATAFEHDDRDTAAVQMLLHVKERSNHKNQWDTYTQACIALANLHENMKRSRQCLANLKDAQSAIEKRGLDSLYPFYAIRMSSYHRVFLNNMDSATYYAEEVLRTAPRFNLILQEAWGHMLMAMLLNQTAPEKMLEHFQSAARLFLKIDDNKGLSAVMANVAQHYFQQKELKKALAYNDTSIVFAKTSMALGDRMNEDIFAAYKFRGEIYKQMGQPDSAWYYLKKGYDLQVARDALIQYRKVIEIDARYNDEKKLEKIAGQAREIQVEKARRNLLTLIVLIMVLLAAALAYFYRQLQQANRKTAQQAEQLKDLDAAKSRFFANISHELRTPLTLVLGPISSLLKESQLSPKQVGLLQMVTRNGEKLNHLINDILDLRKLEAGKMELNRQPTPLAAFFRRHIVQFESLASRKEIDFSFAIAVDDGIVANIDREKCRQLTYNLLSNAFKFTPVGGKIRVTLEMEKHGKSISLFQMSVADDGPGIHPDDLPFVFERFFQTNRPDKPAEGGTGLGLALCQEYVKLFDGKIDVESHLGKGATFRVEFPVVVLSPENMPQLQEGITSPFSSDLDGVAETTGLLPIAAAARTDPAKPTLLVVEDNPELQDYIRLILQDKYNVRTAENGKAALEMLRKGGGRRDEGGGMNEEADLIPHTSSLITDLIISDLMMPVMDGYQLLEKLKSGETTRHIPVIMLTARAEAQDRLKALRIGVDDYLTKPFDEEELQVRVKNLLTNYRNRRTVSDEPVSNAELHLEERPAGDLTISEPDRVWLETFEAYIQKNLSNELLGIPSLAREFAMSESTLLRQLKRLTGLSTVQYLQEIRLDKARHLLENRTYDSIAKVASKTGYSDPRTFSRSFKQRFGKSPSDYLSD
ncbi:MAG: response regulator [Phycisphaerae bacterium]|nr:response regulator [Saprospiraceae bacterium]